MRKLLAEHFHGLLVLDPGGADGLVVLLDEEGELVWSLGGGLLQPPPGRGARSPAHLVHEEGDVTATFAWKNEYCNQFR